MMTDTEEKRKKRKHEESEKNTSRKRHTQVSTIVPPAQTRTSGKIHRIFVRNFMCHEALEILLNPNVNFIVGRNGSGKSALLTALTVGLGARAGTTQRGHSVKEFIKKGKNSATIEINIINEGPVSYKPQVYGRMITVVRQIGATTSSYKLKSHEGKIISSKKSELDNVISKMNIQVENPISVLNQDVSREFLVTTDAAQKYRLFMKATRLEVIGNNYREAQIASTEAQKRLKETEAYLADCKKEVHALQKSLKMLESAECAKEEFRSQQMELLWAKVISEEKKLQRIQRKLDVEKKFMEDPECYDTARQTKKKELIARIEERRNNIVEINAELSETSKTYQTMLQHFQSEKQLLSDKTRDLKTTQLSIKRLENDIAMLLQEINRIEGAQEKNNEKARLKQQHAKLKQDLEEVEAMLRTKQTDQSHLHADKLRLERENHLAGIDLHRCELRVRKLKEKLVTLKQQSENSVTIFGPNVPRLLKRIDEEYQKGRFQKKPIGPLGAYVKVKDATWTPAVESFLGAGILGAFAVDNAQDTSKLRAIMNEIYRGQRLPTVITSKFLAKVHDVSRYRVSSSDHIRLLDVMEISEPVVANCLIDQKEPECVMLIATSKEAGEILSDRHRVPVNCKRALTKKGDEFFPYPNYKSYGGKVRERSKFLQVSTSEAIQAETMQLVAAEEEYSAALESRGVNGDKLERTLAELGQMTQQVTKLRSIQIATKAKLDAVFDELNFEELDNTETFSAEKSALEQRLKEMRQQEKVIAAEIEEAQKRLKNFEELNNHRDIRHSLEDKLNKFKDEIQSLEHQKENLKLDCEKATRKLEEARHSCQKLTAEYERQKRVTDQLEVQAEAQCPRVETTRTVDEIQQMSNELQAKIHAIERKVGSKEALQAELAEKEEKYKGVMEQANTVAACTERHLARLRQRRELFKEVKKTVGQKVKMAFVNILELRGYKGCLKISHSNKSLELEMTPHNTTNVNAVNSTRTLSGGERSYSTVAFILALWDCASLPFYFLDEFDVFMDKVNRRIILDILLDYTRSHPQSQFAFLTPLDIDSSIVQVDDFLTIHELSRPARNGNDQR